MESRAKQSFVSAHHTTLRVEKMPILSRSAFSRSRKSRKKEWMDVKRTRERELNLKLIKLKTTTESVPKPRPKRAPRGRTVGVIE